MLLPEPMRRPFFRFDGVITTLSGILMLAIPGLLVSLFQLGSISVTWIRVVGIIWVAFGLWLLTLWNADYTKGGALFAIIVLELNALLLLWAAILGGFGIGILGWIVLIGTAAFIFYVAVQWWLLRPQLA